MSYFLNYNGSEVSISTASLVTATSVVIDDIIEAKDSESNEHLTASLDLFVAEEAKKIMSIADHCKSYDELMNFIFGDGDFLELLLEREFGFKLSDYPDLREMQISQFADIEAKFI